jgi:hypothetical protein
MIRDDMIQLAREAGWQYANGDDSYEPLWKFGELVAAAERKDCADIAEYWCCNGMPRTTLADQIRAGGQS